MPRKGPAPRRELVADPIYRSVQVTQLINKVMLHGKRSVAEKIVYDAMTIIETKTGSTPSAVDRLFWSRGHRPVRISKYGVGMAALSPALPRLKWHHVLDRHLGLPRAA